MSWTAFQVASCISIVTKRVDEPLEDWRATSLGLKNYSSSLDLYCNGCRELK